MNYLVTGGAGFIGSHLVEKLLKNQNKVFVIDNLSTGRILNLKKIKNFRKIKFIKSDISKKGKWIEQFKKIDCVFHLAALADIVPSINFPEKYILISSGICLNDFWAGNFFEYLDFLEREYKIPVYFIIGADGFLAPEDKLLVEILKKESQEKEKNKLFSNLIPNKIFKKKHFEKIVDIKAYGKFMYYESTNVDNWLTAIRNSYFFVSGRYHHSIASHVLNTPFIAFESNTPKTNAVFEMIDSKNILIKNVSSKINNDELLQELIKKTKLLSQHLKFNDALNDENSIRKDFIYDLALRNYD